MRASRNEYQLVPIEQTVTPAVVPLSAGAKKVLRRNKIKRAAMGWMEALAPLALVVVIWLAWAAVVYYKWVI